MDRYKALGVEAMQDMANNPLKYAQMQWPSLIIYRQQQLVVESVNDNPETYVVAGNQLGAWSPSE